MHLNLVKITNSTLGKQSIGKVGEYTVLTTSINYMTMRQAFFKENHGYCCRSGRMYCHRDHFCVCSSHYIHKFTGTDFFSQERVGQNGKIFKMYKFEACIWMRKSGKLN